MPPARAAPGPEPLLRAGCVGVGGAPTDEADAAEENEAERTARNGGEEAIWSRSEAAVSSSGVRALVLVAVWFEFEPATEVEAGGTGGPTSAAVATGPRLRNGGCACVVRSGAKRVEFGGEGRYAPLLPLFSFDVAFEMAPRCGDADGRRASEGGLRLGAPGSCGSSTHSSHAEMGGRRADTAAGVPLPSRGRGVAVPV